MIKPPVVTPQLFCNMRTPPLLSRATKDRQQTSHSSVLSSSQSLLSFCHPPLNFNTCPCILPPRRLCTCCFSHSCMLFGVAVQAVLLYTHTRLNLGLLLSAGGWCKHAQLLNVGAATEALKEWNGILWDQHQSFLIYTLWIKFRTLGLCLQLPDWNSQI